MVGRDIHPTGEPPPFQPQKTWRKAVSKTKVCIYLNVGICIHLHVEFVILSNGIMYIHACVCPLHTIITTLFSCHRPKHPIKIHVWAGISMRGTTRLILFDGIMDAELYVRILEKALLPSARKLYPGTNYLFMQDNDPKHTSRRSRAFFCGKWD